MSIFEDIEVQILIIAYILFFVMWAVNYIKRKDFNKNPKLGFYPYFIILFLLLIDGVVIRFMIDRGYPYINTLLEGLTQNQYLMLFAGAVVVIGYSIYLTKEIKGFFYFENQKSKAIKYAIYSLLFVFVVLSFLFFSILILLIERSLEKCNKCGKRLTLKEINRKFVSERYAKITERVERERDYKGNSEYENRCYKVHYKTYDVTKKCSNCGNIQHYREEIEVSRKEVSCWGIGGVLLGLATLGILGS